MATDQESSEITAILELLQLVDIRGAVITIDAMGTPRAIAKDIVERRREIPRRKALQPDVPVARGTCTSLDAHNPVLSTLVGLGQVK